MASSIDSIENARAGVRRGKRRRAWCSPVAAGVQDLHRCVAASPFIAQTRTHTRLRCSR